MRPALRAPWPLAKYFPVWPFHSAGAHNPERATALCRKIPLKALDFYKFGRGFGLAYKRGGVISGGRRLESGIKKNWLGMSR